MDVICIWHYSYQAANGLIKRMSKTFRIVGEVRDNYKYYHLQLSNLQSKWNKIKNKKHFRTNSKPESSVSHLSPSLLQ